MRKGEKEKLWMCGYFRASVGLSENFYLPQRARAIRTHAHTHTHAQVRGTFLKFRLFGLNTFRSAAISSQACMQLLQILNSSTVARFCYFSDFAENLKCLQSQEPLISKCFWQSWSSPWQWTVIYCFYIMSEN